MKKTVFIFILLFIKIALIISEIIIMKNDRIINGKIIKMDEDTITVVTKTYEMVIDKDEIKNIYQNESDYQKSLKTKDSEKKENSIAYEEKNFKANEKLEEKYWQLFFNKKYINELNKYKYPENCVILSIYAPVDGLDIIHIKANKLWYEHIEMGLPGSVEYDRKNITNPTIINGIKWFPEFINNISDKFDLKIPIPEKEYFIYAKNINVKTKMVKIIQQPNKENNYTLSISLDDIDSFGDTFFKIIIYYYLPEELSFF